MNTRIKSDTRSPVLGRDKERQVLVNDYIHQRQGTDGEYSNEHTIFQRAKKVLHAINLAKVTMVSVSNPRTITLAVASYSLSFYKLFARKLNC